MDDRRPSPTHIAFSATSTLQVRECYAAALNAGGLPSGAPSHRNNDCGCFNAAVEDLDGNTIEFILREPCEAEHQEVVPAPSENSRVLNWQEDVARSGADDAQSMTSRVSKAKSRAQTALDLASTTSKSVKPVEAPTPGITRTKTEPTWQGQEHGGKAIVGTLLGAAAGAAFAYAMCQSERDGARNEADFAASMRSRPLQRSMSASGGRSRSNFEGKSNLGGKSVLDDKSTVSKKPHRNFSTTESQRSSRYPPRSMPRTMQRMLQPTPYNDDDTEVQDAITRYTQSRRPTAPSRSRTYDALDYHAPTTKSHVSSHRGGGGNGSNSSGIGYYEPKRSSTLPPAAEPYMLEAPKSAAPSRHTSRRGSPEEEEKLKRHDSVVSTHSRHSEARRSSHSTAKPSHRSERDRDSHYESASKAGTAKPAHRSRADSSVSKSSHRDRDHDASSSSRAPSTVKPAPRRSNSTYDAPLPASRAQSFYSAAEKPLPPSQAPSAANIPAPSSRAGSRYTAGPVVPEDRANNMISDLETVVPEDSISCVDYTSPPPPKERERKHGSSRSGSKRSEASTVKPYKRDKDKDIEREGRGKSSSSRHSAVTAPVRARDEAYSSSGKKSGKRSLLSFAG